MEKIDFSVLIPVYFNDNLNDFKLALESVWYNQTLKPSQIIISVDGPLTLELKNYIKAVESDCIVDVVWNVKNSGITKALNLGLEVAKFDIVARMDADDVAHPERFHKQMPLMLENDLISCSLAEFSKTYIDVESIRTATRKDKIDRVYWLLNPFNHPGVIFRKRVVKEAGGYLEMPLFEDWYLWIRMISIGARCDNINEALVFFRSNMKQLNRRRGIEYYKQEMHFIRTLFKQGYTTYLQFILRVMLISIFRFLPYNAFKYITKNLLRK